MAKAENYDAETARGYALVGFIFYILGAVASAFGAFGASLFMGGFMGGMMDGYTGPYFPFIFPSIFLIISAALTIWAWITISNIDSGRYQDAQTASLVLGIFGIFFAWLIGGIFFFLAYGKLGYATRRPQTTFTSQTPTTNPPATGSRFCSQCGNPASEGDKFCRSCGKQLS
jgi:hypothetical protein